MPTHSSLYSALAAAGLENATGPDGKPKQEPYVWERIRGVLSYDETAKDSNGFLRCTVRPGGWDVIAQALRVEVAPRR